MPLEVRAILDILPHRPPFLFIDRVLDWVAGESLHAQRLVSMTDPILAGHFPGHPVLPGVVQVETMAQAAIVLAHLSGAFDPATQIAYFIGIQEAKFRGPVVPGDLLDVHVRAERVGRIGKFSGETRVAGEIRSSAKFTAIVEPKERPA